MDAKYRLYYVCDGMTEGCHKLRCTGYTSSKKNGTLMFLSGSLIFERPSWLKMFTQYQLRVFDNTCSRETGLVIKADRARIMGHPVYPTAPQGRVGPPGMPAKPGLQGFPVNKFCKDVFVRPSVRLYVMTSVHFLEFRIKCIYLSIYLPTYLSIYLSNYLPT